VFVVLPDRCDNDQQASQGLTNGGRSDFSVRGVLYFFGDGRFRSRGVVVFY
jgi:hypothetical protein